MSRMSSHFAEVGRHALLEFNGEAVTHYPGGVVSAGASITALVDLAADAPVQSSDGERIVRRGMLSISTAVTVTVAERHSGRDTFLVRGLLWQAAGLGGRDAALQDVQIERHEPIATKAGRTK